MAIVPGSYIYLGHVTQIATCELDENSTVVRWSSYPDSSVFPTIITALYPQPKKRFLANVALCNHITEAGFEPATSGGWLLRCSETSELLGTTTVSGPSTKHLSAHKTSLFF
jgi:hypothetical protein